MIAAIHQPNFLPWIGYFVKLRLCDVFVFHDMAEFSKSAVIKRTRIRKAKGEMEPRWLTIPVRKYDRGTRISDIEIDPDSEWRKDTLRAIQNTYISAHSFAEIYPIISRGINSTEGMSSLAEINIALIKLICDHLGFRPKFARSSGLNIKNDSPEGRSRVLKKHDLNLQILRAVGADVYISGVGARDYQEESDFESHGIRLVYQDIGKWLEDNPYDQGTAQFVGGMSIVDALMHLGVESVRQTIDRYISEDLPELAT